MSRFFIFSFLVLLIVCSAFADEASHHHEQAKANEVEAGNTGVGDMKVSCSKHEYCCKPFHDKHGHFFCHKCCHGAKASANEDKSIQNSEIDGFGGRKAGKGHVGKPKINN